MKTEKRIENVHQRINKKEFLIITVFSFAFVFSVFVFNQFDILLQNQTEFGISAKEIIWPFLWRCFLIFTGLLVTLLCLKAFCKNIFNIVVSILLGLMIALYLQVLLFNGNNLNRLDGSSVHTANKPTVYFNLLIYIVIVFTPCIIIIFKKKIFKKIMIIVSALILCMQSMGVIGTSVVSPKFSADSNLSYFSIDEYLEVSENENIVVFLLDRLDTRNTDAIFEKWPESKQIFNGFTFYRNNISQYRGTFPSVVSTLTNYEFTETQTPNDFFPVAWGQSKLFDVLHEKKYKINGILDSIASYNNIEEVLPCFDNIKKMSYGDRILDNDKIFVSMLKLSCLRSVPFILKNLFTIANYSNLGNIFISAKKTMEIKTDFFPKFTSPETDLLYKSCLENKGLSQTDNNTFSFVHLNGPHDPMFFDENFNKIDGQNRSPSKAIAQGYGVFKILNEYFNQMKIMNIYKNSTIIIFADHGDVYLEDTGLPTVNATLMIKKKGIDDDVALAINQTAETSNHNFVSTIFEIIGAPEQKIYKSYFELEEPGATQERYVYLTSWTGWRNGNHNTTVYDGKYIINGDAWNSEKWTFIA